MGEHFSKVKYDTRIKNTFIPLMGFFICSLILINTIIHFIGDRYSKDVFNYQFLTIRLLAIVFLVLSIFKLISIKNLIITINSITIYYPFKLKKKEYPINAVEYFSKGISHKDSGNGPGFIEFPFRTLLIKFSDEFIISLNSRDNTNIEELIKVLEKTLKKREF